MSCWNIAEAICQIAETELADKPAQIHQDAAGPALHEPFELRPEPVRFQASEHLAGHPEDRHVARLTDRDLHRFLRGAASPNAHNHKRLQEDCRHDLGES